MGELESEYFGVNPSYLNAMLGNLGTETAELAVMGGGGSLHITGAGHTDRAIIIMGMRI
jgi:hypothetical protein